MNVSVQIKHKYKIPKRTIETALSNINKVKLTFGVHSEDSGNHSLRDRVQKEVLHGMLYANGKTVEPISNAKLLREAEEGKETIFYYGGDAHLTQIPPRPVLRPMLILALEDNYMSCIKKGIKEQLKFRDVYAFEHSMYTLSTAFSRTRLLDFIRNRGKGFWGSGTHNSPYVQAVKYFSKLGDAGAAKIADIWSWSIKNIAQWDTTSIYREGDTPLMDSLDLLNSIKVKIEDR